MKKGTTYSVLMRNVPTDLKKLFKIKCVAAGISMNEALKVLMYGVSKGDIPLPRPEKERSRD